MRKPRLLSMAFAVVMLLTCCFGMYLATAAAAADKKPTFTVTDGAGSPGEEVTVTIDLSNNPGICTAKIWLHYDEGLTLKSAADSGLLVGGIFGGDKTANPYGLYWDNSADHNGDNSSNGTIATLVFTVNKNATNGDHAVWVTYEYGDVYNLDLYDFECECIAGKITVTGGVCIHKYTNYVSNNDATCQADGTKTAKCDNGCGATDTVTDAGSKRGHKYTNYVSNNDATCEADGTKTAKCDNGCGATDTVTDAGSKCGHKYTNYVSNNDATCEADGTKTAKCDYNCGNTDTRTDTGSKLGHDWELTSVDAATCTEDGKEYYTCKRDSKHTKEEIISAPGHTYGEWTIIKEATATEPGEKTHSCTCCGHTETVEIPPITVTPTPEAPTPEAPTPEAPTPEAPTPEVPGNQAPQTGDPSSILLWVILACASFAATAALAVLARRKTGRR